MSRMEHVTFDIIEIETSDIRKYIVDYAKENNISPYCEVEPVESISCFLDSYQLDDTFVSFDDKLYRIDNKEEKEDDSDLFLVTKQDGKTSVYTQFYNGGASLSDMIYYNRKLL